MIFVFSLRNGEKGAIRESPLLHGEYQPHDQAWMAVVWSR